MNSTITIEKLTTYYGYTYFIPSICIFGIICNLINLSVLKNPKLRESPYTYLTGLAVCDLLTLLSSFSITFTRGNWFESFTVLYWLKIFERKCFLPIANIFSALSVTIIVTLTLERYIFIKLPMKANAYCSPKIARKIIFLLFFLVCLFRMPMFFFWSVQLEQHANSTIEFEIKSLKNYQEFQKIYFIISFFIFEIIPFFVLSFLNMKLILLVKQSNREFLTLNSNGVSSNLVSFTNQQQEDSIELNNMIKNRNNSSFNNSLRITRNQESLPHNYLTRRKRDELKMTRTLIALIFLALISEISSIITYDRITEFLIARHFANYMETAYKLQVFISNMIVLTLHSMNFFLFCAFNKKYNFALRQQFSKCLAGFYCNRFKRGEEDQFN